MHLCCAHVLPWSVCARFAQHRAPAASHTGAGHKGSNPYISIVDSLLHFLHFSILNHTNLHSSALCHTSVDKVQNLIF